MKGALLAGLLAMPGPSKATIGVGEMFELVLPCAPSTGYGWEVLSVAREIAAPTGPVQYRQDPTNKGLQGAGGVCSVWFQGLKPGRTTAVLGYRRSWEKKAPAKTFKTAITVLPAK
jgi:predicted secreted protein